MTRRPAAALLLLLAAGVALAGCSAGGGAPSARQRPATTVHSASPAARATTSSAPATAKPAPPNPCLRNTHGQLVKVDLHTQHLWMCGGRQLAYSTAITSGIVGEYTHTPTGDYRIQSLERHSTLTLNTGQQYEVQYWIPFDAPLFGFHDASWQTFPFGSPRYRTHGSHGCVHMPLSAIAFLYHWAHVGTRVHIRV